MISPLVERRSGSLKVLSCPLPEQTPIIAAKLIRLGTLLGPVATIQGQMLWRYILTTKKGQYVICTAPLLILL